MAENISNLSMVISPDKAPQKKLDLSKKTTGEKYYDVAQFAVGKVWIMAFTAAIAYFTVYGKEKYGVFPNVFKKFQGWFKDKLLHNSVYPLAEKGEFAERFAGAASNTMVIFHGGNLFAPVMKWMENSKEKIANYFNKKYGKDGEVKIAHERLKDAPKQSWGDVIKGRLAAWAIVFTSFVSIDFFAGQDKKILDHNKKPMYRFDAYEEWFARKLAGITKAGKALGLDKAPLSQELTVAQDANKTYRLGRIIALDVYATSAAIFIWNFISRLSAKKRKDAARKPEDVSEIAVASGLKIPEGLFEHEHSAPKHKKFADTLKTPGLNSHATAVDTQRQLAENSVVTGLSA